MAGILERISGYKDAMQLALKRVATAPAAFGVAFALFASQV
jgi:hypothetical protein